MTTVLVVVAVLLVGILVSFVLGRAFHAAEQSAAVRDAEIERRLRQAQKRIDRRIHDEGDVA